MSCRVTAAYAEESTVARFTTGAHATVHDLKRRACSELAKTAQQNYGLTNGFPTGSMASIVLSSGSHGQLDFEPSTPVSSLCGADEIIIVTVPAPPKDNNIFGPNTISSTLASPIHSQLHSLLQSHANAITADLLQRFDDVVKAERKEREEALKVEREKREEALKVEREKREEALKVEREKREDLKEALRTEKEKREEGLKVEREKWEKALRVEREERVSEKADASKKYEHLKNHLLEVEETTLDTVGWITNNDTKMLDRIKLRHLLNKAQEILAITVRLTDSPFGASLAWREALGSSDDLPTRLAVARALFDCPGISLDQATQVFLSSTEGLGLVVEARSSIRLRGDRVAHPVAVTRSYFDGPLSRNPLKLETPGLQALVDFVCSPK